MSCEEVVAMNGELEDCKKKRSNPWIEYIWKGVSLVGIIFGVVR